MTSPSPASPAACATLVYEHDGRLHRVLAAAGQTIGRTAPSAVKVPLAGVSRLHCRVLDHGQGGLAVEDLGSSNGTFLDGARLAPGHPAPLTAGARLRLGKIDLLVQAVGPPGREPRAPEPGATGAPGPDRPGGATPPAPVLAPAEAPSVLTGDPARDRRNVALLLETIADLHREERLEEVLPAILDRTLELTGAERGLLLVRTPAGGLEVSCGRTRRGEDVPRFAGASESVPRRVVETGEPVCITGAESSAWAEPASASMREHALRSILCVPLRLRGTVRGVVYVDSPDVVRGFGPAERTVLEALAAQCAVALERARAREAEALERRRLEDENLALKGSAGAPPLALAPAMLEALRRLERVADTDATLLLTGETGTGKEVVARWVHARSHRRGRPLVVVDCGAIPEGLLESVLFGHRAGAFTGATGDRRGLVAQAEGGTVLLDEVGELPLALQPKLLRFLEDRTYLPVGADERRQADVRVIASTHRDLAARCAQGAFRDDLRYRLEGYPVTLPPLRARREDVLPLARLFLARERAAARRPEVLDFTREAEAALEAHAWPGNVRELAQRVQRAVIAADPPCVTVTDLDLSAPPAGDAGLLPLPEARRRANERFERDYVTELLRRHAGRVTDAAREAGVSRQMLQRLVAKHGLTRSTSAP